MSIGNCSHIVVCGCSQIEIHHLHSQETIVADALSRPEPNTVQQHPPTTTATALVSTLHAPPPPAVPDYLSRRCLFFNSPTPRLSFSTYYHPCLLSLFLSPGPIFSMTCPQASSSPWFQRRWEGLFLWRQFTTFLILVSMPLEDCRFQEALPGNCFFHGY